MKKIYSLLLKVLNNTISLNRTNFNTFGIYSNTAHSATILGVIEDITSAAGANSLNKVYYNQSAISILVLYSWGPILRR